MAKITLKNNPISTNGELPQVGTKAPDFVLVDKELQDRSLKDFKGHKKFLAIVPSLDTSVCSIMAKKCFQNLKRLPEVALLVISADLPFAQKRFCLSEHVEGMNVLSMMRNKNFAKDYGILIQDGPLAGLCARALVILGENNEVLYTQLVPEISQEPDYDAALAFLSHKAASHHR